MIKEAHDHLLSWTQKINKKQAKSVSEKMIKNAHIFSAAKERSENKINSVRLRTGKIKKGNACDKK